MLSDNKILLEKNAELIQEVENIKRKWTNLEILSSNIASRFFGDISVNKAIDATLRDMGILSGASRVILLILNIEKIKADHTYEWCAEGINHLFKYFQDTWINSFPWWKKQLNNGEIINISDINNLPEEAIATKKLLIINRIKALLVFPLYDNSELAGLIGYSNDITEKEWKENDLSVLRLTSQIIGNALERHKMENLLKESEEMYRLIIENSNDLIVILNQEYKIEYINEETTIRLLGYNNKEIIGKSAWDFIHPEDVERAIYTYKKGFQPGESIVELRFKHKEEHWVWFESSGQIFIDKEGTKKGIIVSRDITERKSAEDRYESLFENSPNAIFIIDLNGTIIDSNPTAYKLFGLNRNEIVGNVIDNFPNIFNLEVKKFFKRIFRASFSKDFPSPIEIEVKNSYGEYLWVETQASTIKQKNTILIQLIFQDITEKKKMELLENKFKDELEGKVQIRTRELNEALNQQKLLLDQIVKSSQFKTEFMATMSHELRTPLNAIIGFTDLLLEGVYGMLTEEQQEFVSDIKSSAEHQFEMIKHILDISKIESGQIELSFKKFSINNVVEQVESSLKPLYKKKNLQFNINGLENDNKIYADPIRFKEILLNLLSNAIKFTIDGTISLTIKDTSTQWVFKINDTGIGIAPKDFPLIFKEFKRVDSTYVRSVPGTGLGLSLTKRLVELHGGEINFTSVLGIGSTFLFTISKKLEEKNR